MTIEITVTAKTTRLMAALSVAERVTASSLAEPAHLRVDSHLDWGYLPGTYVPRVGVLLYFHHSTDAVRQFAESFGLEVAERSQGADDEDVYTYADGVLDEVPFRAWTLNAVETPAVAA